WAAISAFALSRPAMVTPIPFRASSRATCDPKTPYPPKTIAQFPVGDLSRSVAFSLKSMSLRKFSRPQRFIPERAAANRPEAAGPVRACCGRQACRAWCRKALASELACPPHQQLQILWSGSLFANSRHQLFPNRGTPGGGRRAFFLFVAPWETSFLLQRRRFRRRRSQLSRLLVGVGESNQSRLAPSLAQKRHSEGYLG